MDVYVIRIYAKILNTIQFHHLVVSSLGIFIVKPANEWRRPVSIYGTHYTKKKSEVQKLQISIN